MNLDALILDMDGVLWRGSKPLPGLVPFFETIRKLGMGFVLATNNSTRTVAQYVDKLDGMGVHVRPEQILTSSLATAEYLLTIAVPGARVYAIGEDGLLEALTTRGFVLADHDVAFVVAGLDRNFSYQKMATAMELIHQGARFIGTNPDRTFPGPHGALPGAGAVLGAIAAASGIEPFTVGKPKPLMFQQAIDRLGSRPERTAMVGDRLDTDIAGALSAGIQTILVLSGVTSPAALADSPIQPDYVFENIDVLRMALGGLVETHRAG